MDMEIHPYLVVLRGTGPRATVVAVACRRAGVVLRGPVPRATPRATVVAEYRHPRLIICVRESV